MKDQNPDNKNIKKQGLWRPIVLVLAIITALILVRVFGLYNYLGELRDWIKSLGYLGYLVFVLIYIVAILVIIPSPILTVSGGVLFGSIIGIILVSIASTIGASLAFLIARYFARDAITRWISTKNRLNLLYQSTEKHGAIIVAMIRLIIIMPYELLNYGLGLTQVSFNTYVFWSWLCMLPGTILYIVGTNAIIKGVSQRTVPWLLIGIFVITGIVLAILVYYIHKKLKNRGFKTVI
jgi:uncharacterized membrane protein YdjX (TVP38/TMEM64 family)